MHTPKSAVERRPRRGTRFLLAGVAAIAFALAGSGHATTPTGSFATARYSQSAATLPDGRVLFAGGYATASSVGMTTSVEIYDPSTGTYSAGAALATARAEHATVTLPDGRVLALGGTGLASGGGSTNLASAEIYDPISNTWSTTGAMGVARRLPLALVLSNGKVLVVGGDATGASSEVFDPATGTFTPSGALVVARNRAAGAVLADGRVLVAGGNAPSGGATLASAETWDPATGAWSTTGSLGYARDYAVATTLANGKVLIAGGYAGGTYPATAELYDPATGTFAATGAMTLPRYRHVAATLPDGSVLVSGGASSTGVADSNEVYDVATGAWRSGGRMLANRATHTLSTLPSGNLLIAGGYVSPLAQTELFYPSCVAQINPISPTGQSYASPGGSGSVSLTAPANCGWSITSVPSWMTVTSGLTGMGSATISYTVAPMTTAGGRGATVRIADNNFALNQTGVCDPASTASFFPTSRSFTPAGGSDSVVVTYYSSSCQLTATNVPSWITITGGTGGYGAGTVTYTVEPNTGAYRYATMRIGNKNYQVTQAAPPPVCDPAYVPTLTPASQTFAAGGGSVTVNTTQSAGCTLAVSGVPSWITVTSTFSYTDSGVRYGQVGLSVASNTTGASRSATLTIATKSFVVTQNP